jgi:hypothetical protein
MSKENTITLPAPRIDLMPPSLTKWEREYEAFRRQPPALLSTHRGQYVAIHDGQVVKSGNDRLEVIFRALEKAGNVDIHVGLVTDQQESAIRIPHVRFYGTTRITVM